MSVMQLNLVLGQDRVKVEPSEVEKIALTADMWSSCGMDTTWE